MKEKETLNKGTDFQIVLPETVKENLLLPDPILLQLYQDKQDRVIWMLEEVGEEGYDWISTILDFNRQDKGIPIEQRKPIKCIISNYGGSLEIAKMLSEMISLSKTPVYGLAIGMCASAASMVYLSCHKKFATKNVTILLHKGSCGNVGGNYTEVQQFMKNYEKDIDQLSEFYKSHTGISPEEIDDKLSKGDWYIYIEEALQKKLVDSVITDIDLFY